MDPHLTLKASSSLQTYEQRCRAAKSGSGTATIFAYSPPTGCPYPKHQNMTRTGTEHTNRTANRHKPARRQKAETVVGNGVPSRVRTCDLLIKSQLLQWSHSAIITTGRKGFRFAEKGRFLKFLPNGRCSITNRGRAPPSGGGSLANQRNRSRQERCA